MEFIDFSRLFQRRGGYSLPVLIELKHPDKESWYFTNNKEDITWVKPTGEKNLYISAAMTYKFPGSSGGAPAGGSLEIDIDIHKDNGYELLAWFDGADDGAYINVVGLINGRGEITPISQMTQKFGGVSWDGKTIKWSMGQDDRLNMQINPWVFNSDCLTG